MPSTPPAGFSQACVTALRDSGTGPRKTRPELVVHGVATVLGRDGGSS